MSEQLSDTFQNKALPKSIEDGWSYIHNSIAPHSDVIIFSDINHEESTTKTRDLFFPEHIEGHGKSGVTGIILEELEKINKHAQNLFEGKINKDNFTRNYTEITFSPYNTEEELYNEANYTADAIIAGSKQTPPIKFYMAQIKDTLEQEQILEGLKEQEYAFHTDALTHIGIVCDKLHEKHIYPSHDQITEIYDMTNCFITGDKEYFDIYAPGATLAHILEGQDISEQEILDITAPLVDLKTKQNDINLEHAMTRLRFRIDNDTILANRVMKAHEETGGKIMIVHGALHGAERGGENNKGKDLDELLQEKGLRVTRINIAYNEKTLIEHQNYSYNSDVSELTLFPKTGELRIEDLNHDNKVTGLYNEELPASQIPTPSAPISQI